MVNAPSLSVIVPSYNQGSFIINNISELIKHKDKGLEIIVLDGGSTDNTCSYLESVRDQLDYYVSEKDDGQAAAINSGFSVAKGTWVAFQNSDDFYVPGALDLVLTEINRKDEIDIILGSTAFLDEKLVAFKTTHVKPISRLHMYCANFIHNQSFFIRRDFLEKVGVLDPKLRFCLDYEWFLRILAERPRIRYLNSVLGAQCLHADTKTSTIQDVHKVEFEEQRNKYFSARERFLSRLTFPLYLAFRRAFFFYAKLVSLKRF